MEERTDNGLPGSETADGKCSLEIFQTDAYTHTEHISRIKFAAEVMFTKCVLNGGRQGAIAIGLGKEPSHRSFSGADMIHQDKTRDWGL